MIGNLGIGDDFRVIPKPSSDSCCVKSNRGLIGIGLDGKKVASPLLGAYLFQANA